MFSKTDLVCLLIAGGLALCLRVWFRIKTRRLLIEGGIEAKTRRKKPKAASNGVIDTLDQRQHSTSN
ncbi:MAG: hypothetical protein NTY19_14625 [Planctomycetota bacterium]|nr:hypothetical protein [Planctomycetota bacterium]